MKKTIGILAHVDAGKTTLSEQILYHAGAISSCGRVDHKDTFLDNHEIEQNRGIQPLVWKLILYLYFNY